MYAMVNGTRMYYERHGSGRAVVMIHDRASTHDVWRNQMPAVAKDNLAVVFDSRGVGRSELGPAELCYTTELLAGDVVAFLDELEVDQASLVGFSMGGGVAQMCALRHPQRVASLVLVSTSPQFSPATKARMIGEADRIEQHGVDNQMTRTMTARWFTADFAAARPDIVAEVQEGILRLRPQVLAARSRANAERDFTDRLHEIRCPVLFVAGAQDPMGPSAHAARYAQALKDLEIHLIEGSSHFVPIEAAEEFNRLLVDFVARRT